MPMADRIPTLRVAVTGLGSTTAISVVKGLRRQTAFDVTIIGLDVRPGEELAGSKLCDGTRAVPYAEDGDAFLDAVRAIVERDCVDVLIPVVDPEVEVLASHRSRVGDAVAMVIPGEETVRVCNDKLATARFFEAQGFPGPRTAPLDPDGPLAPQVQDAGLAYPCIVKPRRGVGSRGVYEIGHEGELVLAHRVQQPLVQERLEGREFTVDVLCDEGRLLGACHRERTEVRAGQTFHGEVKQDPEVLDLVQRLCATLELHGPANVQGFQTSHGTRLTEINPRFASGLPLTIAAGLDLPVMLLQLALGTPVTEGAVPRNLRMCRFWEEVFFES